MGLREYIPFSSKPVAERKVATPVNDESPKKLAKLMKGATLALGIHSTYGARRSFESSPYDFDTIIQVCTIDSYCKQAFLKYRETIWKGGYELVSENPDAVDYLLHRLGYMELSMRQPLDRFFEDVGDQLCKFHNCFIAKIRNPNIKRFFPGRIRGMGGMDPIIGYEIVPAETVRIERDKNNRVIRYQQQLDGFGGFNQPSAPEWQPHEMIHLTVDRSPGHLFGEPFMTSVIDDVIALRSLEEDHQNLVHQQLFPIVDVTVGTDEFPGEDEEIIAAARDIEEMQNNGALIHSERRKVEIIGSEGKAMDAQYILDHAKERVAIGLGIPPHLLGMTMNGGNRSLSQELTTAMYDKIKFYQREISRMLRIWIVNEILAEGGFNPVDNPDDHMEFRFNEVDLESQMKRETQVVQLFAAGLYQDDEARIRLGLDPEMDESKTFQALQMRMTPDSLTQTKTADGKPGAPQLVDTTPAAAKKSDVQAPSKGGRPNTKNIRRGAGNQMRPANQHTRRSAPKIRHSEEDYLVEIVELLGETDEREREY